MVKVTLEKDDIEKLIKVKYPTCSIVSGLSDDMEIVIRVDELQQAPVRPPPVEQPQRVINEEEPNALTVPNRPATNPGGAMGRSRDILPKF